MQSNSPTSESNSNFNSKSSDSSQDRGSVSFIDIVENVFYYKWHFVTFTLAIIIITFFYAISSTPVYVADVLIQVEEKKGSNLGALSNVAKALDVQQSPVQGEVEIVRSRHVIGKAVENERAHTNVRVGNRMPLIGNFISTKLNRDSATGLATPFLGLTNYSWGGEYLELDAYVVPNFLVGRRTKLILGDKKSWKLHDENMNLLLTGSNTESSTALIGGEPITLKIGDMNGRPGTTFLLLRSSSSSKIQQVIQAMTATETRRQSSLMRLTMTDTDPRTAASMLNAVADAYILHNLERRSEEADKSLIFLRNQLPQLKNNLEDTERRLNNFRNQEKSIDIPGEIRVLLERSTSLEKTKLELELKRKELLQRFEPQHPTLVAIDNQLRTLITAGREQARDISGLPKVQQEFLRLTRDVEVANQLYVGLLNNAQQLQVAKAGTTGNVSIVDRAIVPERAARPNKPYIMVVGTLIALVTGLLVSQTIAMLTSVVREPRKLELATGLPTFAILPIAEEQNAAKRDRSSIFLLAQESPNCIPVEAMRSLRTAALFALSETSRGKVILITSAVPGQGKSFVSANLAYLSANGGKRVLLIDADVRRSTIGKYLPQPKDCKGLSSFMQDGSKIDPMILRNIFPNLDVLPAGTPIKNPGDLITRGGVGLEVARLAEEYDLVIIDSPPVLPVNDAAGLIGYVDVTLFVARQGLVTQTEVDEAITLLQRAGKKISGLVFNGFTASRLRYGYGYKYSYYRYRDKYSTDNYS